MWDLWFLRLYSDEKRRTYQCDTSAGKDYTEQMCKDKEAYMQKAVPAVLVFSIVATLYGAIDMFHYFVQPIMLIDVIGMVVFLIMLVWFMVYTTKLKNKYF